MGRPGDDGLWFAGSKSVVTCNWMIERKSRDFLKCKTKKHSKSEVSFRILFDSIKKCGSS